LAERPPPRGVEDPHDLLLREDAVLAYDTFRSNHLQGVFGRIGHARVHIPGCAFASSRPQDGRQLGTGVERRGKRDEDGEFRYVEEHATLTNDPAQKPSTTMLLLQSARWGDEAARNALAKQYLPRLRSMAYARLSPRAPFDAEDIVQETLLRAFSMMDEFVPRSEGAFLLYVRSILLNLLIDEARKSLRVPQSADLDEEQVSPLPNPLEEAVGRETWDRYRRAVERLSDQQMEAVVLFVEAGMTFEEIAETIASPSPNAARMVVARGLKCLAEIMHVS
jgi:RNA polymerase sigma-70 factor (ECF subfamily)